MASTIYVSSAHLLNHPTSGGSSRRRFRGRTAVVTASSREGAGANSNNDYNSYNKQGKVVDENMVVLRKRIHEMKMVESKYELPQHWMEWERRHHTSYESTICDALGALQTVLMDTRPSLAIGVMALVTLSVPTTTCLILLQFIEMSRGLMAGIIHP